MEIPNSELINDQLQNVKKHHDLTIEKKWFVKLNDGKLEDLYETEDKIELGKGFYASVYKMKLKDQDLYRAVKIINKAKVKNPKDFLNEITILKNSDHPNVIKIYEVFEDRMNYFITMEQKIFINNVLTLIRLCEGGELFDRIQKNQSLSEDETRYYFKQIVQAISYCHSNNICHRDLKPENCVFLSSDENSVLKVIDFGLSCAFMQENQRMNLTVMAGSSLYMSPEIINRQYNELCDVWSLGVMLYIMVSGIPPFFAPEFRNITPQCLDLISKCLVPSEKRITAKQILKHEWMQMSLSQENLREIDFRMFKSFSQSSKLKRISLSFVASQLSEKDIREIGEQFKSLDLNNDGVLTIDEIEKAMKTQLDDHGMKEILRLFDKLDTNHSGSIDYTEFIAASIQETKYLTQEHLYATFKMMDANNSGTIDRNEIKKILSQDESLEQCDDEYWDSIIAEADINNDGVVDYEEFLIMMTQK